MADRDEIATLIADMGSRARTAARTLSAMPRADKSRALLAAAQAIRDVGSPGTELEFAL